MSTKQNTKTVSREALADTTNEELARSIAAELVASFSAGTMSAKERTFEQARIAYAGNQSGATDADVARETTVALAATFPKPQQEWARETSVSKGGASVTRVTITQRRTAWSDVTDAGMTPTLEAVAAAFSLTSAGAKGLADLRAQLIEDTKKRPKAQREAFYVKQSFERFQELVAKNKANSKRAENAAEASADAKSEGVSFEITLDTVEDIAAYVAATVARRWSEDDAARLAAIFAGAAEAVTSDLLDADAEADAA